MYKLHLAMSTLLATELLNFSLLEGCRHQDQDIFLKTNISGRKTKSKTKTLTCASRPSRDQDMSPDFPSLITNMTSREETMAKFNIM